MEFITLSSILLSFTIIVILLTPLGQKINQKERRLKQIEGAIVPDVDEELSKPFSERFLIPIFYKIIQGISRLIPKSKKVKSKSTLGRDLKLAGIKLSEREFSAMRLVVALTSMGLALGQLTIGVIPPLVRGMLLFVGVVLAILIPRYYLQSSIKKRQTGIRNQMPDILDLLSVSVEAGLGFDAALIRVCDRSIGPLVEELMLVYREIQMGKPRRESLKALGERNSVPELKIFASSLIQADQLGISVKNVLKAQSQQLRLARKQRAEEKALKAPVKMMIPLVVFIFPVIFLILLGPSVIQMMQTFGGKG